MTLMPIRVSMGKTPRSVISACPRSPKALGMEGPVTSASSIATCFPARRKATARREVTMDLPTPPLPLTTPMTLRIWLSLCAGFLKEAASRRSPQFAEQLPQSCVQFGIIKLISCMIVLQIISLLLQYVCINK